MVLETGGRGRGEDTVGLAVYTFPFILVRIGARLSVGPPMKLR